MLDNFRALAQNLINFTLGGSAVSNAVATDQSTGFVRVRIACSVPSMVTFLPKGQTSPDWSKGFLMQTWPEYFEVPVGTKVAAKSLDVLGIGLTGYVSITESETRT